MRKSSSVLDKYTLGRKQARALERLGASGKRLGSVLGRLGSVLGASWSVLGASWAVLVAFKVVLDVKMSFESVQRAKY